MHPFAGSTEQNLGPGLVEACATGPGAPAGGAMVAEWQARHLASYWAVVVDRTPLWGSWQVMQPNAPPLSVLHRLQVQPAPCERTQPGFSRSPCW